MPYCGVLVQYGKHSEQMTSGILALNPGKKTNLNVHSGKPKDILYNTLVIETA